MKFRVFSVLLFVLLLWGCASKKQAPTTTSPADVEVYIPTPIYDPLQELVNNMSVEELVGQLFLARYPGMEEAITAQSQYHIGGWVLFGVDTRNQTPASLRAEIDQLQAQSAVPLIIAVDEEGGSVTRVSGYSQYRDVQFPSLRTLYQQGGLDLVLQTEEEKCILLKSLGINTNLAPVCDIATDQNAFMYSRSIGLSPQDTATCIASMVELMSSEGVGSVLKHFPGYGNNIDTHTGTATDHRTLDQLQQNDLVPFQAGMDAGCGAVMVTHTIITSIDPELPASLSPAVVDYLRKDMEFQGVIMTDDLAMQAITDIYGVEEAAVMAVEAGIDVLCCSEYEVQYQAVLQAVKDGRISVPTLMKAAMRVIQWKHALGLI